MGNYILDSNLDMAEYQNHANMKMKLETALNNMV